MRSFLAFLLGATVALSARADREALLRAIAASPAEDTPRLVYADWLDEQGEHDRARFIRAQIYVHNHATRLSWGMRLASGSDTARMAPLVFVPRDGLRSGTGRRHGYTVVDDPTVVLAERISRELFDSHWAEWVEEIPASLRRSWNPQDGGEARRELAWLPGRRRSDAEKRWLYARFRRGFFGAVHAGDFKTLDASTLGRVFDEGSSTITELVFDGAFPRPAVARFFQTHPWAVRRLQGLSLSVPQYDGVSDVLTETLLGSPDIQANYGALEDVRLQLDDAYDLARSHPPRMLRTLFEEFFGRIRPRRLFLRRNRTSPAVVEAFGQGAAERLYEALVAPNHRSVGTRLSTLAVELGPLTRFLTEPGPFIESLEHLRAFRLGPAPGLPSRADVRVDLRAALATCPRLAVIAWDALAVRNFEVSGDAFPALRLSIGTARRVREHGKSCAVSLADLATLGIVPK